MSANTRASARRARATLPGAVLAALLAAGSATAATATLDTPLLMNADTTFTVTVEMTHSLAWRSTEVLLNGNSHYCHGAAQGHPPFGPYMSDQTNTLTFSVPRPADGSYVVSVIAWRTAQCDPSLPALDGALATQKLYVTSCTPPADQNVLVNVDCLYFMDDFTGFCPALAGLPGVNVSQEPPVGTDFALGTPVAAVVRIHDSIPGGPATPIGEYPFTLTPVSEINAEIACANGCGGSCCYRNSALSIGTPASHPSLIANGQVVTAQDTCGTPGRIRIIEIDGTPVDQIAEGDYRRPAGHPGPIVPLGYHDLVFEACNDAGDCTILPAWGIVMYQAVPMGCWDLNENGLGDSNEDRNGDEQYNGLDCQGVSCWDLNGNFACDPDEDVNDDQVCNAADCEGPPGSTGPQGPTGPGGPAGPEGPAGPNGGEGPDGPSGPAGASCWDLNGNAIGDLGEDANSDGNYDALDCQGPQGPEGPTGREGPQGPPGEGTPANEPGRLFPNCGFMGAVELTAMLGGLLSIGAVQRRRYGR